MPFGSLYDLYVDELKDIYSAENQILKALPKMIKASTNDDLKQALEEHMHVTEGQVQRLEQIFDNLGSKSKGKKCVGMEGLIEEGKEVIKEGQDSDVLDAGLIGAAQKVEHYEISAYGTARAHAEKVGDRTGVNLLQETLNEEKDADKKLTSLAESYINELATEGDMMGMSSSSQMMGRSSRRMSGRK